jgi:hypothetical protein
MFNEIIDALFALREWRDLALFSVVVLWATFEVIHYRNRRARGGTRLNALFPGADWLLNHVTKRRSESRQ